MHTSLFSKIFNGLMLGWTLWMYRPHLKSVALPVPKIIVTGVLAGSCEPPIQGKKDGANGVGNGAV